MFVHNGEVEPASASAVVVTPSVDASLMTRIMFLTFIDVCNLNPSELEILSTAPVTPRQFPLLSVVCRKPSLQIQRKEPGKFWHSALSTHALSP